MVFLQPFHPTFGTYYWIYNSPSSAFFRHFKLHIALLEMAGDIVMQHTNTTPMHMSEENTKFDIVT